MLWRLALPYELLRLFLLLNDLLLPLRFIRRRLPLLLELLLRWLLLGALLRVMRNLLS